MEDFLEEEVKFGYFTMWLYGERIGIDTFENLEAMVGGIGGTVLATRLFFFSVTQVNE